MLLGLTRPLTLAPMVLLGLTRSLALAPFGPNERRPRPFHGDRGGFATPGADSFAAMPVMIAAGARIASEATSVEGNLR